MGREVHDVVGQVLSASSAAEAIWFMGVPIWRDAPRRIQRSRTTHKSKTSRQINVGESLPRCGDWKGAAAE